MRDLHLRPAQGIGWPHEGAAALPPADQPIALQRSQGRPYRGPADAEKLDQRQLGGEALGRGDGCFLGARPERLLDLVAQGNRRVVGDRRAHLSAETYNRTSAVSTGICRLDSATSARRPANPHPALTAPSSWPRILAPGGNAMDTTPRKRSLGERWIDARPTKTAMFWSWVM